MCLNTLTAIAVAVAAQSQVPPSEPAGMHPVWIVAIIAVAAVPAFFILHLVVTTLMLGRPYEFPLESASRGPTYCPHCGKEINRRPG